MCKISAQYVKACMRKVRKTGGRRPWRTDGHHHTIIRPVWRRAYKNLEALLSITPLTYWCFSITRGIIIYPYCPQTTQTLNIIWARSIMLNLRSKTRQRTTLMLLTLIYSIGRDVQIARFMTNATIFISTSQATRSWIHVVLFNLRRFIAFSTHSLYDIPGLATQMNAF